MAKRDTSVEKKSGGGAQGKPNILIIWGDDIGQSNLSCYTKGVMGYRTPNIDRIANEGMIFTDYYGEQSCTAGRSAFITGAERISHRFEQGGDPRRYAGDAG
jgi:arylsulfatase A-like enzyme